MNLSTLLQDLHPVSTEADRDISGLALDSRAIKQNNLFLAIKGGQEDGCKYIQDAISRGATAVLVDRDGVFNGQINVPLIPVPDLKHKLGEIAARFHDYPAKHLRMIGITGTSGKTSCSHFMAQSLQSLNIPCGIIGTLGSGFYDAVGPALLTTPDAVTLQSTLHDFVTKGAKAIAMEVSSHSIDQGRINAIPYEIGIFTNLSQDHLDYHNTMEAYAAVKRRFLADMPVKHLIINADDAHGRQWINELSPHKSVIAYGLSKPSLLRDVPLVYADHMESTPDGSKAIIKSPWGDAEIVIPLVGQFNLSNAIAILTALCVYGVSFQDAVKCLSRLKTVPGRMQTLTREGQPLVVIDYAHKPDALEKVLQALRHHTQGKLWCVFGCGGERDRGKRPLMASIAERLADHVIVTNDNPRHEKPEAILADIMQGFSNPKKVSVELNRSKAILNSIQLAQSGDCILIAGKGAELYQQIGDEKIPFDDLNKAREYLEQTTILGGGK